MLTAYSGVVATYAVNMPPKQSSVPSYKYILRINGDPSDMDDYCKILMFLGKILMFFDLSSQIWWILKMKRFRFWNIRFLNEDMDGADAYERKDTVIFSGSDLPTVANGEIVSEHYMRSSERKTSD